VLGEKDVGRIGSACVSPTHGPIALALVRREAEPGDAVDVDGAAAEVVELPFR
jgi:glycine cleavage system aminomethyltransferase T